MALENFTTYTDEVDPNNRITVSTSRVTWASLPRNEDAYLYDDKGASYFSGNFVIEFTFRITAFDASHRIELVSMANLIDDARGIDTANGDLLGVFYSVTSGSVDSIVLEEIDGGAAYYGGAYNISTDTDYYIRFERDETVGTYGTVYAYIYSDVQRTSLLSTLSITLHTSTKNYQYLYACQTYNIGAADTSSGYVEALEIVSRTTTPTVTTQDCTSITTTTATGNGTIVDLGSTSVTGHGHCWKLGIDAVDVWDATTSNNKTTLGGGSLGTFTSSIGGLTPGIWCGVRAYAENSAGTSYGGNFTFKVGLSGVQVAPRQIAMGNTTFLYTGRNGKRYWVQGTPY